MNRAIHLLPIGKNMNRLCISLLCVGMLVVVSIAGATESEITRTEKEPMALSFKLLEETERYVTDDKTDIKSFPSDVLKLHGQTIIMDGYFLIPQEAYFGAEPVKGFSLSKNP